MPCSNKSLFPFWWRKQCLQYYSVLHLSRAVQDTFRSCDCSLDHVIPSWCLPLLSCFYFVFSLSSSSSFVSRRLTVISHGVLPLLSCSNQDVAEKQNLLSFGSVQFNSVLRHHISAVAQNVALLGARWFHTSYMYTNTVCSMLCYQWRATVHTAAAPQNRTNL